MICCEFMLQLTGIQKNILSEDTYFRNNYHIRELTALCCVCLSEMQLIPFNKKKIGNEWTAIGIKMAILSGSFFYIVFASTNSPTRIRNQYMLLLVRRLMLNHSLSHSLSLYLSPFVAVHTPPYSSTVGQMPITALSPCNRPTVVIHNRMPLHTAAVVVVVIIKRKHCCEWKKITIIVCDTLHRNAACICRWCLSSRRRRTQSHEVKEEIIILYIRQIGGKTCYFSYE